MILVTSIGGGTVEEVENDILNSKVKELWVGGGRSGGGEWALTKKYSSSTSMP